MFDTDSEAPKEHQTPIESLSKIREILFGQQAQATDRRIDGVEDRLSKELQILRAEVAEHVATLETGIASEAASRTGEIGKLETDLSVARQSLEDRIVALESQVRTDVEALRREFARDQETLRRELEGRLERKVDREALGGLLGELARRLEGPAQE